MKKMLVVEDDILSQKMMNRLFKDEFEISFCASADEYYTEYSNQLFDIIIMDISLKGRKTGFDLIKEIKNSPNYNGTPIIILTAHAEKNIRQTATVIGSDLFFTKPVQNTILKDAVSFLVNSKTSRTIS